MKKLEKVSVKNRFGKVVSFFVIPGDESYNAPFGKITENGYLVLTKKQADEMNLSYTTHFYSTYGSVAMVRI